MKTNIIMVLAIAFLAVSCDNQNATKIDVAKADATEDVAVPQVEEVAKTSKLAVYYIDQVLTSYKMAINMQADFQKQYATKEKELQSLGRKLEKDYAELQSKVQSVLITRANAEAEAMKLQERQQGLAMKSEQAMQEFAEKEGVMTNQIYHSIAEFVNELNDGKWDIVFASQIVAGPVVSVNPSLDITAEVIEGLNKKYDEINK